MKRLFVPCVFLLVGGCIDETPQESEAESASIIILNPSFNWDGTIVQIMVPAWHDCFEAPNAAQGQIIHHSPCDSATPPRATQEFSIVKPNWTSAGYQLRSVVDSRLCLNVQNGDNQPGDALQLFPCNFDLNEIFVLPNGYAPGSIQISYNWMYLTAATDTFPGNVVQEPGGAGPQGVCFRDITRNAFATQYGHPCF